MIDLTAFQQLILLDVAIRERYDGAPHGLAIKEDLTKWYTEAGELDEGEEVNHGRLYPNLDKLVDRGLLEKETRDKRTNEYSLTDAGTEEIADLETLIHVARGKDAVNPYGATVEPLPADD